MSAAELNRGSIPKPAPWPPASPDTSRADAWPGRPHKSECVLSHAEAETLRAKRLAEPEARVQALCASSFQMGQLSVAAIEYSAGYVDGWRWGLACGVIGAMLIGAAVLLSGFAGYLS